MTTPSIDPDQKLTAVGGRLPMAYMQNGHAFDMDGNYLGEADQQGNLSTSDAKQQDQGPGEYPSRQEESLRDQYVRWLGTTPHPNIKDETMRERIEQAKNQQSE